ncbi:MAG: outer membrane lipoprotein-sorting protein [Deltaproteobacteria bacterium]|nr:outer membrane lipoprotein-sorting protein [Deltaproteobacteria bacterium]
MRYMPFAVALAWGCVGGAHASASLEALIRKADLVLRADTAAAVIEMKVKTSSYSRTMKLVSWADDRGQTKRALIKILGPALWRGYGTLKIGAQLKLYNPQNDNVTVVGNSMLGDSWMGSHFTNDDLVKETRLASHYRFEQVRTWQADAPAGGKAQYYLINLYPKPTAPVAWGRIAYTLWQRAGVVIPERADYFRKANDKRPQRRFEFTNVKALAGRLLPTLMKATVTKKPGEYTTIEYKHLKLDLKIPAGKFTEQALKR